MQSSQSNFILLFSSQTTSPPPPSISSPSLTPISPACNLILPTMPPSPDQHILHLPPATKSRTSKTAPAYVHPHPQLPPPPTPNIPPLGSKQKMVGQPGIKNRSIYTPFPLSQRTHTHACIVSSNTSTPCLPSTGLSHMCASLSGSTPRSMISPHDLPL